jgi:hypothetical protein
LTEAELKEIEQATQAGRGPVHRTYTIHLTDIAGELVALVKKTVAIEPPGGSKAARPAARL